MRSIIDLVLRIADLAEAEGRVIRQHAFRFIVAALLFVSASVLLIVGVVALGTAAMLGLLEQMHPGWAVAFPAVFVLLCSGALGTAAIITNRPRRPQP